MSASMNEDFMGLGVRLGLVWGWLVGVSLGLVRVRVRIRVRVTIPTPSPLSYLAYVLSCGVDLIKRPESEVVVEYSAVCFLRPMRDYRYCRAWLQHICSAKALRLPNRDINPARLQECGAAVRMFLTGGHLRDRVYVAHAVLKKLSTLRKVSLLNKVKL